MTELELPTEGKTPPLAPVFERFPKSRYWAYVAFAGVSLVVTIIASMLIFDLVPEHQAAAFRNWTQWLQNALSLVGVAFGFTAAMNVSFRK